MLVIHVAASPRYRLPKSTRVEGDFEPFRSSELYANGCLFLAIYDFLLVFYSDFMSRLNHSDVIEAVEVSRIIISKKKKEENERHVIYRTTKINLYTKFEMPKLQLFQKNKFAPN